MRDRRVLAELTKERRGPLGLGSNGRAVDLAGITGDSVPLFGSRISGERRQSILDYINSENEVLARQDLTADHWDAAIIALTRAGEGPSSLAALAVAADTLAVEAGALVAQQTALDVPDEATALNGLSTTSLELYRMWAGEQRRAVYSRKDGIAFDRGRVAAALSMCTQQRAVVDKETSRLLKSIKVTQAEMQDMTARALAARREAEK